MSERDFVMLKKLGEGSFGEVYKVKRISDMAEYAMKKVPLSSSRSKYWTWRNAIKTTLWTRSESLPRFSTRTLSSTRRPFTTRTRKSFVRSWNLQKTVTYRYGITHFLESHQGKVQELRKFLRVLNMVDRTRNSQGSPGPSRGQSHPQGFETGQHIFR